MELTLHALRKNNIANSVYVVRDGEEALDFLFCRNSFQDRSFNSPPKLVLLDVKLPKVDGLEVLQHEEGSAHESHSGGHFDIFERAAGSRERVPSWCQQLQTEAGGLYPVSGDSAGARFVLASREFAAAARGFRIRVAENA